MRGVLAILTGLAILTAGSGSARAELEHYTVDKPHTQIVFAVNHLGFSTSIGKFTDYEGRIAFDPTAPKSSSVEVSIATGSLDLDDVKWNEHLKGTDFFDVAAFPAMTFKSTSIEVTGEKTAKITGDLTLKGVTKPVVLDTVWNQTGKHPFTGKTVAGFSATAKLKRSDFGIMYGLPMVGDDVEIRLEVEAIRDEVSGGERQ